jgi:hypothetical protein
MEMAKGDLHGLNRPLCVVVNVTTFGIRMICNYLVKQNCHCIELAL